MKAAVFRARGAPLAIEEIEVGRPGPREVLVRTAAVGVCHSDLHVIDGAIPTPPPAVLGHEPAGIVEEVGAEVRHVAPGDRVIGCLSVFCGSCEYCATGRPYLCGGESTMRGPGESPRLSGGGEPIGQFAHLGAFAERMLVHENALVKIRPEMPLDRAALIGCGVTTGLGAALNTARVRAGSTVAVIGCGGVGLAVIQGCRIAAVDTAGWKLELARALGASEGMDASVEDATGRVLATTSGGVDYAFEAIGLEGTVQQALRMTRKGGTAVLVGVMPIGSTAAIPAWDVVLRGKTILGCMMGANRFRVDMPRYVDLYQRGQLKLDEMISARIPLEQVNEAFEAMRKGTAARSVVVFAEERLETRPRTRAGVPARLRAAVDDFRRRALGNSEATPRPMGASQTRSRQPAQEHLTQGQSGRGSAPDRAGPTRIEIATAVAGPSSSGSRSAPRVRRHSRTSSSMPPTSPSSRSSEASAIAGSSRRAICCRVRHGAMNRPKTAARCAAIRWPAPSTSTLKTHAAVGLAASPPR